MRPVKWLTLSLGLFLSSAAFASDDSTISAEISGECGDTVTLSVTGTTNYRVVVGDPGSYTIADGLCKATDTEPATTLGVVGDVTAPMTNPVATFDLPRGYCGLSFQVLSLETGTACETSDVLTLPNESASYDAGFAAGEAAVDPTAYCGAETIWDSVTEKCESSVIVPGGDTYCDGTTTTWNSTSSVCESTVDETDNDASVCAAAGGSYDADSGICTDDCATGDTYCDGTTTIWNDSSSVCESSVIVPGGDTYCDGTTTTWDSEAGQCESSVTCDDDTPPMNCLTLDDSNLSTAVASCLTEDPTGNDCPSVKGDDGVTACPMGQWDVSNVTNMDSMFAGRSLFNTDLSGWDVSSVTSMDGVFAATTFNANIGAWDVSSVTSMRATFAVTNAFNADIGAWDVSNVTDMESMFDTANAFNADISGWDVSNVTDMSAMFNAATSFNVDIGCWDVSKVTKMGYMFYFADAFDQNLSCWDMASVVASDKMFSDSGSTCSFEDGKIVGCGDCSDVSCADDATDGDGGVDDVISLPGSDFKTPTCGAEDGDEVCIASDCNLDSASTLMLTVSSSSVDPVASYEVIVDLADGCECYGASSVGGISELLGCTTYSGDDEVSPYGAGTFVVRGEGSATTDSLFTADIGCDFEAGRDPYPWEDGYDSAFDGDSCSAYEEYTGDYGSCECEAWNDWDTSVDALTDGVWTTSVSYSGTI